MRDGLPRIDLHASAVAFDTRAVVILGKSGQGKSAMALQLMAFGADLVGDDRLILVVDSGALMVSPAESLTGLIEARGVGVLQARARFPARVHLCLDLDHIETERVPPIRHKSWLDVPVPCLNKVDSPAFPAAVVQYMKAGRAEV